MRKIHGSNKLETYTSHGFGKAIVHFQKDHGAV